MLHRLDNSSKSYTVAGDTLEKTFQSLADGETRALPRIS